MEIIHRLERKDYVQFNLFQIAYSEKFRKRLAIQRLLVSLLFIGTAIFVYLFLNRFSFVLAGIFLLTSVFWYFYFPTFSKKQVVKSTERAIASGHLTTLFDEIRLKINARGIEEITSRGNLINHWQAIQSIDLTKDYIYIFMGETSAIIIPKRNLEKEQYKEFKKIVDKYYPGKINNINR